MISEFELQKMGDQLRIAKASLANCENSHAHAKHFRPCENCSAIRQYIVSMGALQILYRDYLGLERYRAETIALAKYGRLAVAA